MLKSTFTATAFAFVAIIAIAACSKNKTVAQTAKSTGDVVPASASATPSTGGSTTPTTGNGTQPTVLPRAQFIAAVSVDPSISQLAGGTVCANLIIPNYGSYQGQQVIELFDAAAGGCPSNAISSNDPATIYLLSYTLQSASSSTPTFTLNDGYENIGIAISNSGEAGDPSVVPTQITSLCNSNPSADPNDAGTCTIGASANLIN